MTGPDFSSVDSREKAQELLQRGQLEKLLMLPAEFGGNETPENLLYVPVGFAAIKAKIDLEIVAPLIRDGKVTRYRAVPEYQGSSFVPIALNIVASEPGNFSTAIAIWGDALNR